MTPEPPIPPSGPSSPVQARPVVERPRARPASLNPLELATLSRSAAAGHLGLALVTIFWPTFLLSGLLALAGRHVDGYTPTFLIGSKAFEALVVLILAAFLLKISRLPPAAFGFQGRDWGRQFAWGIGTLAACYLFLMAAMILLYAILALYPAAEQQVAEKTDLSKRIEFFQILPVNNLAGTILLLVFVAIHEEVLFRGLLIPHLRRLTGSWWLAVPGAALIFGALHYFAQGTFGAILTFGLGLVFGTFFVLSRSLPAVIVGHFLFNFLQIQLFRLMEPLLQKWSAEG